MIDIKRKEDCVGCGACSDICSRNAISFKVDNEGFWYPNVDISKCINCGLCEVVCPIIHAPELNRTNKDIPIVIAAYHNNSEIRFQSTSGGIFFALSEEILADGGFIGGAVWTDNFDAKHILSDNIADLERIMGSKYIQSETFGFYKQLRRLLFKGKKVLICGCPCQMAAVRSYLGKDYDNLIIIDFICSNICSPKVFRKYLDSLENRYGAKVVKYHPKNKEYGGWHHFAFKAVFKNGAVYHKNGTEDDFTHCFIGSHIASRPCCFECRFKKIPRISDITIADFWGIDKVNPKMDSPSGTSLVLLNNEKGKRFYHQARHSVTDSLQTIDEALRGNSNLIKSIPKSKVDRQRYYFLLDQNGFDEAVRYSRSCRESIPLIIRIKNVIKKLLKINGAVEHNC